jgi:hypothetical protein
MAPLALLWFFFANIKQICSMDRPDMGQFPGIKKANCSHYFWVGTGFLELNKD